MPDETRDAASDGRGKMNARELFVVLLRVVGLFLLIWAIEAMPVIVGQVAQYRGAFGAAGQMAEFRVWALSIALVPIVRAILGIVLLVSASRIAFWFYPETAQETEPVKAGSVSAADVYRIACFLLGAFVLMLGVPAAARAVVMLMGGAQYNASRFLPDLVTACVFFLFAVAFMFGASGIAQLLRGLDYDPENVPAQQFSLRVLMFIILGVALILGLIRYFIS
jgi:hypothetical protein